MSKTLNLLILTAGIAALSSCSKMGALSADNFTVTPSPMEEKGGKVDVTINGRFPQKYLKRKAVVTVTPVITYAGGSAQGKGATFQGEKVEGNNQTISYKVGGNYTMKSVFDYVPDMQKSELVLQFNGKVGKKAVKIPDVKVADGVIATSTLLKRTLASANPAVAPDAFVHVLKQKQEANIRFLIQQANIRNSELKKTSVQDFIKTLREIKADGERRELNNVEVSAYASPDGGVKLNDKLAAQREKSTKGYVNKVLKKNKIDTNVDTRYTAQDWDGFQELVKASNIQDKDVILRVLSMYKDPQQREEQIKNISAAFRELADEVLPQLRRSRLTINYDLIGRSDDEIEEQYKSDPSKLSVEELLYYSTFSDDNAKKAEVYKKTAELYPSDYRAYNNLAAVAYANGDYAQAKSWLSKASQAKASNPETEMNLGMLSLLDGDVNAAEGYMAKGTGADNYNEALGNLSIAKGDYASAAKYLSGVKSNSAALAQILAKDYASAGNTLSAIAKPDATTSYLKAILAARQGNKSDAISALRDAIAKDNTYASYAAKDLEFAKLATDATFKSLVK
jgi:Flp pilus assembly protein TadD